jgi:hypothetical protein
VAKPAFQTGLSKIFIMGHNLTIILIYKQIFTFFFPEKAYKQKTIFEIFLSHGWANAKQFDIHK